MFISDWLSRNIKIYACAFVMKYALVSQYYYQSLKRFRQREIISFDLQNIISILYFVIIFEKDRVEGELNDI